MARRRRRPGDRTVSQKSSGASRSREPRSGKRRERMLPPWLTMLGSLLLLILAFAFIFFVARGCVATQEATQVRKYVTNSASLLSESSNAGNNDLQGVLANAGGDPANLDVDALAQAASQTERNYRQALEYDEVPPEFEDAQPYLVSALGIRASATGDLADAASSETGNFGEAVSVAVEDYRLSDSIVRNHYLPESQAALEKAGQQGDQSYLDEPEPFMDYEQLGFDTFAASAGVRDDPNARHGIQIKGVEVAGEQLSPGEDVVLTGSAEPVFAVTVVNGGEVVEAGVPVEVVMDTAAERQAHSATIPQMEPNGEVTVEVSGFRPGELEESAEVSVKAGPVEYEENQRNNVLAGTVTFGI